jgi:hypothetical protein
MVEYRRHRRCRDDVPDLPAAVAARLLHLESGAHHPAYTLDMPVQQWAPLWSTHHDQTAGVEHPDLNPRNDLHLTADAGVPHGHDIGPRSLPGGGRALSLGRREQLAEQRHHEPPLSPREPSPAYRTVAKIVDDHHLAVEVTEAAAQPTTPSAPAANATEYPTPRTTRITVTHDRAIIGWTGPYGLGLPAELDHVLFPVPVTADDFADQLAPVLVQAITAALNTTATRQRERPG